MAYDSQQRIPERVLIMAFQGWSDAGGAATTATQHLISTDSVLPLHIISSDGYVDMQMYRPTVTRNENDEQKLDWPDSRLFGPLKLLQENTETLLETKNHIRVLNDAYLPEIYVLEGTEPAFLWQTFAEEIMDLVDTWDFDLVVTLGAMFSDAPHSRPIPITLLSEQKEVRTVYDADKSNYEGPVGILSVIQNELINGDVPNLSLWAQVPHYVHSSPSPKATLAILDRLEEILNVVIPRGSLLEEANEWEKNINQLASQDVEMTNYIERLEEARDSVDGPAATGEAIAYELEKFLRKGQTSHELNDPTEQRDSSKKHESDNDKDDLD